MAINFSSLDTSTPAPQEAVATQGISLNLNKGQFLDLGKAAPSLTNVDLAAGWDVSAGGTAFDLDISAYLLNSAGKLNPANPAGSIVFFNNKSVSGVTLNGDNLTGAGDGDDEVISVNLAAVTPDVEKIVFAVNIFDAQTRGQVFNQVSNSYVRLVNKDTGQEISRFSLKEDFGVETAVIFAELVRNGSTWAFHAIGEGLIAPDLNTIAGRFL